MSSSKRAAGLTVAQKMRALKVQKNSTGSVSALPCPNPVSSPRSFAEIKAAFLPSANPSIVVVVGPVGCGKSFAVHETAKASKFFLSLFDPSDRNVAQEICLASRAVAGSARRAVLVDDLDGFSNEAISEIVSFFLKKWKANGHFSSIFVTIASSLNGKISSLLKSDAVKVVRIAAPTGRELVAFGRTVSKFKAGELNGFTPDQVALIAEESKGDIRVFLHRFLRFSTGKVETQRHKTSFDLASACLRWHGNRARCTFPEIKAAARLRRDVAESIIALDQGRFTAILVQHNVSCTESISLDDIASCLDALSCLDSVLYNNNSRFDAGKVGFAAECEANVVSRVACSSHSPVVAPHRIAIPPKRSNAMNSGVSTTTFLP